MGIVKRIEVEPLSSTRFAFLVDEEELRFCLGLLTQLKADDLIIEDQRRRAIVTLTEQLNLARSAQRGAWVSQGEGTKQ